MRLPQLGQNDLLQSLVLRRRVLLLLRLLLGAHHVAKVLVHFQYPRPVRQAVRRESLSKRNESPNQPGTGIKQGSQGEGEATVEKRSAGDGGGGQSGRVEGGGSGRVVEGYQLG